MFVASWRVPGLPMAGCGMNMFSVSHPLRPRLCFQSTFPNTSSLSPYTHSVLWPPYCFLSAPHLHSLTHISRGWRNKTEITKSFISEQNPWRLYRCLCLGHWRNLTTAGRVTNIHPLHCVTVSVSFSCLLLLVRQCLQLPVVGLSHSMLYWSCPTAVLNLI